MQRQTKPLVARERAMQTTSVDKSGDQLKFGVNDKGNQLFVTATILAQNQEKGEITIKVTSTLAEVGSVPAIFASGNTLHITMDDNVLTVEQI